MKKIIFTLKDGNVYPFSEITGLNDPICNEKGFHETAEMAMEVDDNIESYENIEAENEHKKD